MPRSAVLDGAPGNNLMFRFYATTSEDIVAIDRVDITGPPLYQVELLGRNDEPPAPEFLALVPRLAADSWVTTPGATLRDGPDLPGGGNASFYDLSNDGPQIDFLFAQLTTPVSPAVGPIFSGQIMLPSGTFPFNFVLPLNFNPNDYFPEPSALALAGIAATLLAGSRRVGRHLHPVK